jgi:hypothetical protein
MRSQDYEATNPFNEGEDLLCKRAAGILDLSKRGCSWVVDQCWHRNQNQVSALRSLGSETVSGRLRRTEGCSKWKEALDWPTRLQSETAWVLDQASTFRV